ncbi:hypothetical protein BDV09DRAFT_180416 [Aspergillus tetrazonus]
MIRHSLTSKHFLLSFAFCRALDGWLGSVPGRAFLRAIKIKRSGREMKKCRSDISHCGRLLEHGGPPQKGRKKEYWR